MKTRRQEGYIYKKNGYWYVRFYQREWVQNGSAVRKQRAVRLAPVSSDYRSKRSVEPLRDELFTRLGLNTSTYNIRSTMTLNEFAADYYFPQYVPELKPSVGGSYRSIWRKHLGPLCGASRLRDFRTYEGQHAMAELAHRGLAKNTLKRIKSLLSGVFAEAIRQGALEGVNPMREVRLPRRGVKAPRRPSAYSLEEIQRMLQWLSEPARTVVQLFAYSGLRRGEVSALRWENIRDEAIWVEESAWHGQFTEPKSAMSKAPVPMIGPLAEALEAYCRGAVSGLVFQSDRGTPMNLNNLAMRSVRPVLEGAGIEWKGWHGFRRGLATNLKQLGVDDKSIQAVLRHADYTTTLNVYVQPVPESVKEAMKRYENLVCTNNAPGPGGRVS